MAQPVKDVEKKLLFSVLQYLTDLSASNPEGVDVESLDVAIQCLGTAFSLDVTDEEQIKSLGLATSLKEIFKYGLVLDASDDSPISSMLKTVIKGADVCRSSTLAPFLTLLAG
jgi:hypothetical protein